MRYWSGSLGVGTLGIEGVCLGGYVYTSYMYLMLNRYYFAEGGFGFNTCIILRIRWGLKIVTVNFLHRVDYAPVWYGMR